MKICQEFNRNYRSRPFSARVIGVWKAFDFMGGFLELTLSMMQIVDIEFKRCKIKQDDVELKSRTMVRQISVPGYVCFPERYAVRILPHLVE